MNADFSEKSAAICGDLGTDQLGTRPVSRQRLSNELEIQVSSFVLIEAVQDHNKEHP